MLNKIKYVVRMVLLFLMANMLTACSSAWDYQLNSPCVSAYYNGQPDPCIERIPELNEQILLNS